MLKLACEFGITPASSSKVRAEPIKNKKLTELESLMQ